MAKSFHHETQQVRPIVRLTLLFPLVTLVVALVGQVATGSELRVTASTFFLIALGSWAIVLRLTAATSGSPGSDPRAVGAACGVALVLMVVFAPATSKDFNSYAIYGRMVSEYHLDPYVHAPLDVAGDRWFPRVSPYWAGSPSVYGPAFTLLSAAITTVAGDSFIATRVMFQLVALIAVVVATAIVAVVSRNRALAIGLVGLNPVILTYGVNDAHADVLVGTLLLAATVLLVRRPAVAGVLFVTAAMVKVTAALAFVGAGMWLWTRHRSLIRPFVVVTALSALAWMAIPNAWHLFDALSTASTRHSRFSVFAPLWNIFDTTPQASGTVDVWLSRMASITVLVAGSILALRHRSDRLPYLVTASGLVAFVVFGAYVLPWYAICVLPLLALVWRSTLAAVAMACPVACGLGYFSGYVLLAVGALLTGWVLWCKATSRRPFPWIVPDKPSNSPILAVK
jgi:hypothetical protein